VVHGIGSLKRILRDGDIISVDVTVEYEGYIGDNAVTVPVGQIPPRVAELLSVTEAALALGIKQAVTGNRIGDISHAVQAYVEGHGFSIVREMVGHGVGRSMHEEPQIPNFGRRHTGEKIRPGMTLAIEPMVNLGLHQVRTLADGWTVVTADGTPSAHFEHTVLTTESGPEILTIPRLS
jgi:methionyl aminopeptidase